MSNQDNHQTQLKIILGVIGLLAIFLYFPMGVEYIWDDRLLVLQNGNTHGIQALGRMWVEDLWAQTPGEMSHHWYRPLMTFSLWIDHTLLGQNPNLAVLHSGLYLGLCGFFLWHWLLKWTSETTAVALGVGFFILHPLQMESMRFISARNDLMSMAALLALANCLSSKKTQWFRVSLYSVLALFSKESSLLLIPIILFLESLRTKEKPQLQTVASSAIPVFLWFGLREMATSGGTPIEMNGIWPTFKIATSCLFNPLDCPAAAPALSIAVSPITGIVGLLCCSASLINNRKLAIAGLIILFPSLILGAFAALLSDGMAHRYLLWPVVALSFCLTALSQSHLKWWMPIVILVPLASLSHKESKNWTNTIVIWEHAHDLAPSPMTACGLFKQYEGAKRDAEAYPLLLESVTSEPVPHCCFNATRFPFERGIVNLTIEAGNHALKEGCQDSPELLAPLAMAEALVGNWDKAETHAVIFKTDPWGYGPVVLTAAALRRGDSGPLEHWTREAGLSDTALLREQAEGLIEESLKEQMAPKP